MLSLVRHTRACPKFSKITKQQNLWEGLSYFFLFVACSYTTMEATVLSCHCSWLWSSMPKVLWSNKSPISLERVVWFCWFFASSYLYLVRYPLKLQRYTILRWYWQTQPLSQSDCQMYQVDFLLPLKLEEILCHFGLWPQNNLGQSVCRIF